MKIYALLTVLLFMGSCYPKFTPCENYSHPSEITTRLFPVNEGNKWFYQVYRYDIKGDITDSTSTVLEIGGLDSLYYLDDNFDRQGVLVHRLLINGETAKFVGFLKCENSAILVTEYGYIEDEIKSGRTYPNTLAEGWEDKRYGDAEWAGPEILNLPIGSLPAWRCEYVAHDAQKIIQVEYFSYGIGIVRKDILNKRRRLLQRYELTDYEIVESGGIQ